MDFHSLARRELQALCKKNKIPANMTNIAMADALKALEIVEGIEDLLKPSESETAESSVESPEKTVVNSPCVPRTGYRTSTRRKPIGEESEGSKVLARTRRSTRRAIAGEVDNAKLDVPETPATPSGRKRAPAASACRKIETQLKEEADNKKIVASASCKMEKPRKEEETSVLKVYSTRRSTRLLEKKMRGLDLNDKEGIEPVHFEASEEMSQPLEKNVKQDSVGFGIEPEVKGMNQLVVTDPLVKTHDLEAPSDHIEASDIEVPNECSGMNQQVINDPLLKTDDLEAVSDEKFDVLLETVRELEDNVKGRMGDTNEVDVLKVKPQKIPEVFDESDTTVLVSDGDDEVYSENNKDDDDSDTKTEVDGERYGGSGVVSGENLEKSLGLKDEIPAKGGHDESGLDSFLHRIENTTECLMSESGEGFNGVKQLGSEDVSPVVSSGHSYGEDTIECLVSESGEGSNDDKALVSESGEDDKDLGLKDLAAVVSSRPVCSVNTTEFLMSESGEGFNGEKQLGSEDVSPVVSPGHSYGEDTIECLVSESGEGSNDDKALVSESGEDDKDLGLKDLAAVVSSRPVCSENTTEFLMSESGEGLNGDTDFGLQAIAAVVSSGRVCGDIMDPVVEDSSSKDSEKTESDIFSWSEESDMDFVNDLDDKVFNNNQEQNNGQDLETGLDTTNELSDEKTPSEDDAFEIQDIESTVVIVDKFNSKVFDVAEVGFGHSIGLEQSGSEEEITPETLNCGEESDKYFAVESTVDIEEKFNSKVFDVAEVGFGHSIGLEQSGSEEEITPETLNCGEESDKYFAVESPVQIPTDVSMQKENMDFGDLMASENLIILTSPSMDKTPGPVIPNAEVPVETPFSTSAADPLPGQMAASLLQLGLNSENATFPASQTPMKKSSSKTPTASRKISNPLDDKENMDNSGKKLNLSKDEEQKDKKKAADSFDSLSLRQLKKTFRNLTINDEKKNVAKMGRARPALQTLSENCSVASGPENGT